MRLLVDTHAFLWHRVGDRRLSDAARSAIDDAATDWYLSAASVWEIAIKAGLGRITLPSTVSEYIADKTREGLQVMAIEGRHAAAVERLPSHHHDPFDRLLIAQAKAEQLTIVTADPVFEKYGIGVLW
jgi:PIN domain nuclease of toxin-antitoxin system